LLTTGLPTGSGSSNLSLSGIISFYGEKMADKDEKNIISRIELLKDVGIALSITHSTFLQEAEHKKVLLGNLEKELAEEEIKNIKRHEEKRKKDIVDNAIYLRTIFQSMMHDIESLRRENICLAKMLEGGNNKDDDIGNAEAF
jgi:hypothetical protein